MSRLVAIEAMIEKRPDDPFPRYARAMELRSQGRAADALAAYADVAARFPAYVPTYLMGAQLSAETGDVEGARSWSARGIEAAERAGDDHALSELRTFASTLGSGA